MSGRAVRTVGGMALLALLGACVTHETKPLAKINAIQATRQIPEDERLDVEPPGGAHAIAFSASGART